MEYVEVIDAVDELKEPDYSNTTDDTEKDAEVEELFENDKSWQKGSKQPEHVTDDEADVTWRRILLRSLQMVLLWGVMTTVMMLTSFLCWEAIVTLN